MSTLFRCAKGRRSLSTCINMQMFMFVSALATECLVLSNLLDYPYLKSKTALGTSVERMTTTVTACLPQAASILLYSLWLKLLWSCVWMLWGKLVNKAAISTAVSDSQKTKHMPSNMEASGTSGFHHCKFFHTARVTILLSPLSIDFRISRTWRTVLLAHLQILSVSH